MNLPETWLFPLHAQAPIYKPPSLTLPPRSARRVDINIKQPKRWPTAGAFLAVLWLPFRNHVFSTECGFGEQADRGSGLPPWDLEERVFQARASTEKTRAWGYAGPAENTLPGSTHIRTETILHSHHENLLWFRLADSMSLTLRFPIDFVSLWCLSNTYFLFPKLAISFIF